ncbi:hypothetical protein [Roseomonas populi]|uniref:Uncharacterized protein n=1 Tax=Roseomonas populi TaxID=3121582 RepID=A0ABT1X8L4_9PROT|nr:hypothetical protein [Roseomonas pecuniae]MCR0984441.1 hypothetical protein [Roseomonas pecuniae]
MILAAAWHGLWGLVRALGALASLVLDPLSLLPSGKGGSGQAPPETEEPAARQVVAGDPPVPVGQAPRERPPPPGRGP